MDLIQDNLNIYLTLNSKNATKNTADSVTTDESRELTEERLLDLFNNARRSALVSVAKTCNVSIAGSKADIIFNLKKASLKVVSGINKIFTHIKGQSGGWLTFYYPQWHSSLYQVFKSQ